MINNRTLRKCSHSPLKQRTRPLTQPLVLLQMVASLRVSWQLLESPSLGHIFLLGPLLVASLFFPGLIGVCEYHHLRAWLGLLRCSLQQPAFFSSLSTCSQRWIIHLLIAYRWQIWRNNVYLGFHIGHAVHYLKCVVHFEALW